MARLRGPVIKTAIAMSARSDSTGHFSLTLPRGITHLSTQADQYSTFRTDLDIDGNQTLNIELLRNETMTVHAEPDVLSPDLSPPLHAGRSVAGEFRASGIPLSVPGFRPDGLRWHQGTAVLRTGVAGDHGEPIAQFLQVILSSSKTI
jgi:hypothetical protein